MFVTIGSVLLAICGLPEAIIAYRTKNCTIGIVMLLMWFIGEFCLVIFALQTKQYILLINYIANLIFVYIMIYYKVKSEVNIEEDEKELDKPNDTMLH
jgi:uncharacterized protein with PQ loop repeat